MVISKDSRQESVSRLLESFQLLAQPTPKEYTCLEDRSTIATGNRKPFRKGM
jgi:hypothetical protein